MTKTAKKQLKKNNTTKMKGGGWLDFLNNLNPLKKTPPATSSVTEGETQPPPATSSVSEAQTGETQTPLATSVTTLNGGRRRKTKKATRKAKKGGRIAKKGARKANKSRRTRK